MSKDSIFKQKTFRVSSLISIIIFGVIAQILNDLFEKKYINPFIEKHPELTLIPYLLFALKIIIILLGIFILAIIFDLIFNWLIRPLIGKYIFQILRKSKEWIAKLITATRITPKDRYVTKFLEEERTQESYKSELIEQIDKSKTIYFLLLSAYTMFYDDKEKFIFEHLKSITSTEMQKSMKNIRILLLERGAKGNYRLFESRGRWFVREMKQENASYRVTNYTEYVTKCEGIERELKRIGEVKFYKDDPIWRLFIFDTAIYVSIYGDRKSGHQTPIYKLPISSEDPFGIATGFIKYYQCLWKPTH